MYEDDSFITNYTYIYLTNNKRKKCYISLIHIVGNDFIKLNKYFFTLMKFRVM